MLFGEWDPSWPAAFARLAAPLRAALGDVALRIDHIGSTAVPGLAAKPIIDLQISVGALEPMAPYRGSVERCGWTWRADNTDLTKRYFRERPGAPRAHLHVRAAGSLSEQQALVFRDYLRAHPEQARSYGAAKRALAVHLHEDRAAYVEGKAGAVWEILRLASDWAQRTGWRPGPSDA